MNVSNLILQGKMFQINRRIRLFFDSPYVSVSKLVIYLA